MLWLAPVSLGAAPLSWETAVQLATQNNAEVQAAQQSYEAAEAQATSAGRSYFPELSASLAYSQNYTKTRATDEESNSHLYGADLNLSQNLFGGFADQGRIQTARATARARLAQLRATKARLSAELMSSFGQLQFAQDYVKLTESIIRRREENMRLVDLRFQSGNENKGSLLLSKANLAEARLFYLQAKNALEIARTTFARLLGTADDQQLEITGAPPMTEPQLPESFEKLSLATPAAEEARAQLEASEGSVTVARSNFFPSLDLSAALGRQGPEWFPENDHWNFGVSLKIPLWAGGRDDHNLRAARLTATASQLTLANTQRDQLNQLHSYHAAFREAVERVRVNDAFVQAAEVRATVGRSKYNNGLLTFDQWNDIEADLIKRQNDLLSSRRDRVNAEANWLQAQGAGAIK